MPGIPGLAYPLINGVRYSFASIEAFIDDVPVLGIASLNYSSKLAPGIVRGTSPVKLGRTIGEEDHTCDFEMYRLEWNFLLARLAAQGLGGFGAAAFSIQVNYAESPLAPVTTDQIIGNRVTEAAANNQKGSDPTMVKLTTDVMTVLWNGLPITPPQRGLAIA